MLGATAPACRSPRRQAAPSRARFEALLTHQTFDPMQPTGHPFGDQVMPHAPSAIGPVTRHEARPHLDRKLFVGPGSFAAWPCQPRIKATTRDTERPAEPSRRPDSPVLRDEGELHVLSFAK